MLKAYLYPQCGTSRKAKKWLGDHGISYQEIHIVDHPPSKSELYTIWQKSKLPLKKFYNTSGQVYKELGLKDKISSLSEEDQLNLLASNGKLLKRPILVDGDKVTVGFDEATFNQVWKS